MKKIATYTAIDYEYNSEIEAKQHSEIMKSQGFYETTPTGISKFAPKNKVVRSYQKRHKEGIYY